MLFGESVKPRQQLKLDKKENQEKKCSKWNQSNQKFKTCKIAEQQQSEKVIFDKIQAKSTLYQI